MKKLYIQKNKTGIVLSLLLLCFFATSQQSTAQLNPLRAIYFNNQYLANPAMAGVRNGLNVNLHYRQQWSSLPDAPVTQGITGDYRLGESAGVGLNLIQDNAGIISRTKAMGTYAYHLPLSAEDRSLHFGISLGVMYDRVNINRISGDEGDASVARYNDRGAYLESEFGVAYTDDKLTLQASFPNIRSFVDKGINEPGTIDRSTFFAAASYKFSLGTGSAGLEPKVAFRGIKGFENIVDAGANLTFVNDQFNLFGMYHSSENVTLGAGVNVLEKFKITGMYTSGALDVNSASSAANVTGGFEVGLQAFFGRNND